MIGKVGRVLVSSYIDIHIFSQTLNVSILKLFLFIHSYPSPQNPSQTTKKTNQPLLPPPPPLQDQNPNIHHQPTHLPTSLHPPPNFQFSVPQKPHTKVTYKQNLGISSWGPQYIFSGNFFGHKVGWAIFPIPWWGTWRVEKIPP